MHEALPILIITAASIGFFHTLFGPDHYLPFIVMSQSEKWSLKKTTLITFLCGLGHVLSSVLLGIIGITFGILLGKLVVIESFRGNIAAWALITFGFFYFIWGIHRAIANKPHQHIHAHNGGVLHQHTHSHTNKHVHAHLKEDKKNITPWVLFTIFIFGPCEPLIPILMYPAAQNNIWDLIFVALIFSTVTIGTMISIVLISTFGISFVPLKKIERYTHALAGATICLCGLSIQLLGL